MHTHTHTHTVSCSYTLECNYNSGRQSNALTAATLDNGRTSPAVPYSPMGHRFSIQDFEEVHWLIQQLLCRKMYKWFLPGILYTSTCSCWQKYLFLLCMVIFTTYFKVSEIAGTFFHEFFWLYYVISWYYYCAQTLGWSSSGDICPLESSTHYWVWQCGCRSQTKPAAKDPHLKIKKVHPISSMLWISFVGEVWDPRWGEVEGGRYWYLIKQ